MTTLLLTRGSDPRVVQVRRSGVCARLLVRARALALDHALAKGASPDSSAALSLRAQRLISPRHRVDVAHRFRGLLRAAGRPVHPFDPALPVATQVLLVQELIEEVVEVLESDEAIDARGVAGLEVLLRDGAGPLYGATVNESELRRALEQILDALAFSPPIPADA
ncbi:MAG TPA: hypothetical protein VME22_16475 [Solirubrobacteraceae bacterium]|nr:hypothetical protein [Solirubrobacteraceae bacterium]